MNKVITEGDISNGSFQPKIITRSDHNISRANISPNALRVLYRLNEAGYQAHLVGGSVRDLLLGREPKDFDIGTDAHPEDVRRLFRNCRLIGRRFRLAHILFGREVIEVATFRALSNECPNTEGHDRHVDEDGRIVRDNVYGSIGEDAWRRDFTVNALFYNIRDFSVIDFVDGMSDLEAGVLRLIGEPEQRYREDPVRMLRAIRFAAKLGFRIHGDTETSIPDLAHLLQDIPAARLYDEVLKLFQGGYALSTFELLRHYNLFGHLFPLTEQALAHEEQGFPLTLVSRAMDNTDLRLSQGKPVTPAFLLAVLLWEPMRLIADRLRKEGMSAVQSIQVAGGRVLSEQAGYTSIPRRFSLPMREIWQLQPRLEKRAGRGSLKVLAHPRFRAAYDFLLLRCESGEAPEELGKWWTDFQEKSPEAKQQMIQARRPRQRSGRGRRPSARKRGEGN
jgi:poly(A) polymerase